MHKIWLGLRISSREYIQQTFIANNSKANLLPTDIACYPERADNRVEWSRRGRKPWSGVRSGRLQSGNGAGSRLNRPLTARSNLLHNVYNPHTLLSAVSSFSLHSSTSCTMPYHLFKDLAQPFTYMYNPAQGIII